MLMMNALLLLACLQSGLAAGEPRRLADGMKFTEGPVADGKGNVYFSDIPANRIMKWDGKALSVWMEDSGGANGLKFDKDASLLACQGGARRIARISADKKVAVVADAYEGKRLNSPNDLVLDSKGGIYFTDPRYGKREGMELDKEAVYYVPPGGGKLLRVADDLVRPNGLHIDGERIYIADAGGGKTYAYGMNADGSLRDKKEFAPKGSDGLKVDEKGNVYLTTGGKVEIYSREGASLGSISLPEVEIGGKTLREGPANLCFDGKTLYITARTGFYALAMTVSGN
jgi:gluconolactonase